MQRATSKFLIAGALALAAGGQALAADLPPAPMPPRAPAAYVPAPIPYYNWTGFYIGGNLGGIFTSQSASDTLGSTIASTSSQSFLGGGQVGANYQFWGGVVIGAEADFDWLPNTQNAITATNAGPPAGTATATVNSRWLTLVDARVGYAWDRLLVYGKGGWAFGGAGNSNVNINGAPVAASVSNSNSGWTAGAGIEYAFWGTWSVRAEYDFIRMNNATLTVPNVAANAPFGGDVFSSNNRQFNMVTVGLNYKFGGW
jgi:outer membrane immunogenic protein